MLHISITLIYEFGIDFKIEHCVHEKSGSSARICADGKKN
jgi:hypothetical protein